MVLTLCQRDDYSHWTFSDGVSVHEELKHIEISKIRAVCDQQSRSRWTVIASRNRLYQFIAMSNVETQQEMRQKALSLISMDSGPSTADFHVSVDNISGQALSTTSVDPTAANEEDHVPTSSRSSTKRCVPSHITV